MPAQLGQLHPVSVRSQWPDEAADFTPWLAKEESIARLGEALGLELEVVQTEVAVGPYSADILARDSAGDTVVIENQLGKTDHDHMGKALTYAAVLGAHTVVWVAAAFSDEHRIVVESREELPKNGGILCALRHPVHLGLELLGGDGALPELFQRR